jgi:hypothetical protein
VCPTGYLRPEARFSEGERTASALAMVSFLVCSVVGQLLVLWWARRHDSSFARRYAWASLALEHVADALGRLVEREVRRSARARSGTQAGRPMPPTLFDDPEHQGSQRGM